MNNQSQIDNKKKNENLQIQTFGKRIFNAQTVQEYLLEFLIVFLGERGKKAGNEYKGEIGFNKIKIGEFEKIPYLKRPNIGLKRFVFFDKTKIDSRFNVDIDANNVLNELLGKKIESESYSPDSIINILKDLLYGFSMVTRNRGWFAQALMPISRETIFCEAIGSKSKRRELSLFDGDEYFNIKTDTEFEFKQYSFQARGGEVYFLHLLQGLNEIKNKEGEEKALQYRESLNNLVLNLVDSFEGLGRISRWVQGNWLNFIDEKSDLTSEEIEDNLLEEGECQWIVEEYERRSPYTVKEVINLLKADINEFEKINLLSKGIVIQILRMMSEAAYIKSRNDKNGRNRPWIIHFNSKSDADLKIKRLSVEGYKEVEEDMMIILAEKLKLIDKKNVFDGSGKRKAKSDMQLLKDAYDDSYKLLRKLGKDIGIITPLKGDNMRFTLSDDIIRFFILALIPPNSKVTLETFLKKLYTQYGIVIGPIQYNENINIRGQSSTPAPYLKYNLDQFQLLLKRNGFLKELSDATAMVINPYNEMEGD